MTESSSAFTLFLLAQFRVVATRAKLTVNEVDAIAAALAAGLIDTDAAIKWASSIGVLDLIPDCAVITASTS